MSQVVEMHGQIKVKLAALNKLSSSVTPPLMTDNHSLAIQQEEKSERSTDERPSQHLQHHHESVNS